MTDIPLYPEFRALAFDDLEPLYLAFLNTAPVISEFTFTNLYAWREPYALGISRKDGFLLIRCNSQATPRFFPPIGNTNVKLLISQILQDSISSFIRIPESVKTLFDKDPDFSCVLDKNNSDYLFRTSDLINLPGKKYDGKRNLIKKFKSEHAYEYVKLNPENAHYCLDFEETWCSIKDCDSVEGLKNERNAIREMIAHFKDCRLIGGAIKIGGKVAAVALGEKLNASTLVMHVLKADPNTPGLYQVINNDFLSKEGRPFELVNMEQDLGIEGLRKAKSSYHPCTLIHKYTLTLK